MSLFLTLVGCDEHRSVCEEDPFIANTLASEIDLEHIEVCGADAFNLTVIHPGTVRGLTEIKGSLTIDLAEGHEGRDVQFAFPDLTRIEGNLTIRNFAPWPGEHSVDLSALTSVGGEIAVRDAPIERLELNVEVADSISVVATERLTALSLPVLTDVGVFNVSHSPVFEDLRAEKLAFAGKLDIINNSLLETLTLPSLERVDSMYISDNAALTHILLPALDYTNATTIFGNPVLVGVDLSGLTSFLNVLRFTDSPLLVDIDLQSLTEGNALRFESLDSFVLSDAHMPALTTLNNLSVYDCPSIRHLEPGPYALLNGLSVTACDSLTSIDISQVPALGGLLLSHNPVLTAVEVGEWSRGRTFPDIPEHWSGVLLESNDALEVLDLGGLSLPGGQIVLRNNTALHTFQALEVPAIERIEIFANPALKTLALPAVTRIGDESSATDHYRAIFERNGALETLSLPALQSIQGRLSIRRNDALAAISAPSLQSVATDVMISNNAVLETLDMIALREVGGSFIATRNPSLPTCEAMSVVFQMDLPLNRVRVTDNLPAEGNCID